MSRPTRRVAPRILVGATIALATRLTRSRLGRWLILTLLVQGTVAIVAGPLLVALFQSGLAAAGIGSLTTTTLGDLVASPGAIALVVLFLLLAVAALVAQAAIIAIAADGQQADPGGELPRPRAIAVGVARRLRALVRPSTLLLLPYLLLLAPLGHAALGSVLTRWVAIPSFISGELMRSPSGTVAWVLLSIVIWYVNLRLILTVPFVVVGGMTAPQAFRASWAATRWRLWRLVGIILTVVVVAVVALLILGGLALGATAIADAIEPDASPVVAGIAFAVAQVVAFFVIGTAVVVQTQAFVRIVRLAVGEWEALRLGASPRSLSALRLAPLAQGPRSETKGAQGPRSETKGAQGPRSESKGARWPAAAAIAVTVAGTVALAFAAVPALDRVADGSTFVIAHRGLTDHAVENTIPALEAAAAAGADLVEFDVQQTKDGDWVVMHDFDLQRLAGMAGAVKDMTLAEATAITVREGGNEGTVPSMREWVQRAKELGMPLLIEIKPHGGETADYLERFYAILDEVGITDVSLYHSLSADVVAGQKAMRPTTTVGYIVPISFGAGVPDTPADFVVVEEFSYSDALREQLHASGRGIFVWTVNDENAMRGYLRDGVDGIVTDRATALQQQRDEIADETGLAPKLLDALGRAITLW